MELSKGELAVFDTNEILLKHLSAKLKSVCGSEDLRQAVLSQITHGLSNQQLVTLLQADQRLNLAISDCPAYRNEKEVIGEKLFVKVQECEPELAEKITGMILDLDVCTLLSLLNNNVLLKQAIDKCKTTYYSFLQESEYKEELGGKVYETACKKYSEDVSSHLTGMLLELDTFQLEKLIINPEELLQKLKLCYDTYSAHLC